MSSPLSKVLCIRLVSLARTFSLRIASLASLRSLKLAGVTWSVVVGSMPLSILGDGAGVAGDANDNDEGRMARKPKPRSRRNAIVTGGAGRPRTRRSKTKSRLSRDDDGRKSKFTGTDNDKVTRCCINAGCR